MADTTGGFSDIVQRIADAEVPPPRKRAQPTTAMGIIKNTATEYPRASITAGVGGTLGYQAVKGWKTAYKEGLDVMRARVKEEAKAVEGLTAKGMEGISRLKGTNAEIRALANEYAIEKIFAGGVFQNSQAKARLADLKTPRVILRGETVPLTSFDVKKADLFKEGSMSMTTRPSPFRVAVDPRQVTAEVANAIPKFGVAPHYSSAQTRAINVASPETWEGALAEGAGVHGQGRIAGLPKYSAPSGIKPSIPRRIAEIGTGGKLGKGMIALEALALGADMMNEEGDIQRAYREGKSYYGVAGGLTLGGLKTASRAGRGATNIMTLGAPEYLGVYDTVDLLQARAEGHRRYMANREALKLPVKRSGSDLVPVDGPYLQMFEAQAASEMGIQPSLMTEKFYKGPAYDYKVHEGKLLPVMKPEYASLYDSETDRRNALARKSQNILNADPSMGPLGWTYAQDPSKASMLNAGSESPFDTGGYIR
jgi:hypothetical protein